MTASFSLFESTNATAWNVDAFVCPATCVPFMSLPDRDMRDEFECADGPLVARTPPHIVFARNAVRAVTYDPWLAPVDLNGSYWFGNPGDGTYQACVAIVFPAGEEIGVVDCAAELKWPCMCPTPADAPPEGPHVMARNAPANFSRGRVGFDGTLARGFEPGPYSYLTDAAELALSLDSESPTSRTFVEHAGSSCFVAQVDPPISQGLAISENGTLVAPIDGLYILHSSLTNTTSVHYARANETIGGIITAARVCPNATEPVVVAEGANVTARGYYEFGARFAVAEVGDLAPQDGRLVLSTD